MKFLFLIDSLNFLFLFPFWTCFIIRGMVSLAIDTIRFIHAFLRVCMIFFPTFIANFIFPTVVFSVTKLLTFIASDGIRDKLQHSHPVVTHPDIFWQGLALECQYKCPCWFSLSIPEYRYPVHLYDTFLF